MEKDHLKELAKAIEKIRLDILLNEDNSGLGPMSEQYFLLALSSLDQAQRHMRLAHIHLMREDLFIG